MEKKTERDKERARREELIEKRRQHYYQSLKRAETKESKPKIHDPTALTKLDSKRSSMKTLDQISEISRYTSEAKFFRQNAKLKLDHLTETLISYFFGKKRQNARIQSTI